LSSEWSSVGWTGHHHSSRRAQSKDRIRVGGVGVPGGMFKVTSHFALRTVLGGFWRERAAGGIPVMPLAHPLACACRAECWVLSADSQFPTSQAKLTKYGILRMQRRGERRKSLLSIVKGQGPGTRNLHLCSHVLCDSVASSHGPTLSNRHHRPGSLPTSLHVTGRPADASPHQPTTPSLSTSRSA
jgi:hypothetical protein